MPLHNTGVDNYFESETRTKPDGFLQYVHAVLQLIYYVLRRTCSIPEYDDNVLGRIL